MSLRYSLRDIRVTTTHVCETAQAILEGMDKVPKQLPFVHSDSQEQIQRIVEEAQTELKTQLVSVLDTKVASLEA